MSTENNKMNENMQDVVIFMSAYKIDDYKKNIFSCHKKMNFKKLLADYHILSFATDNTLLTPKGKLKYFANYNSENTVSTFNFEVCDVNEKKEDYEEEINNSGFLVKLTHSISVLLDKRKFKIPFFVNLESFYVDIASEKYKVEPLAFFLNSDVIICFELINYRTGIPLKYSDIYGRNKNYNIISVDAVRYSKDKDSIKIHKRIPEIIFENIACFLEQLLNKKFEVQRYSFVHNILVLSNNVEDVKEYFSKVLGVTNINLDINNINNNTAYNYYSQEYLGVVNMITDNNFSQALYDCQLLEALKMYILLEQIITYDIKQTYNETIDAKLSNEILLHLSGVPIITLNAIDNIKHTNTYRNNESNITLKISFLKLLNERKKNRNSILLNVLLYILAFVGGIDALEVLNNEFLLPFKHSFIAFSVVFFIFGVFWLWREKGNK